MAKTSLQGDVLIIEIDPKFDKVSLEQNRATGYIKDGVVMEVEGTVMKFKMIIPLEVCEKLVKELPKYLGR